MRIECWLEHRELMKRPTLSAEAKGEILNRLKAHTVLAPLYWQIGEKGRVWADMDRYSVGSAKVVAMALVEALWDLTMGEMQVRLWD